MEAAVDYFYLTEAYISHADLAILNLYGLNHNVSKLFSAITNGKQILLFKIAVKFYGKITFHFILSEDLAIYSTGFDSWSTKCVE